ncbi:unnamed protein product [Scytosiphon promiscuus]
MAVRRAMLVLLPMLWTTSAPGMSIDLSISSETGIASTDTRQCTVDELLPLALSSGESLSSEWAQRVGDPLYGCDCAYLRARYFCPLAKDGYPRWVPRAVSDGTCSSVTTSQLAEAPLPPGFKVLLYGNSYLRQMVESMMCVFREHVMTKRIKYYEEGPGNAGDRFVTVAGSAQCRSCEPFRDELVDHGCLSEIEANGEACRCSDGTSEYTFANGAVLHYQFAGGQQNKRVSAALPHFNVSAFSYYDAVIANYGNPPSLEPPEVLAAAAELKDASVPFFWLSTYEGLNGEGGDVDGWALDDRVRMDSLGVKYVRVGVMALGLDHLRKKNVQPEVGGDPHFCLPGPPNEMALLLLKLVWASYFEHGGNAE